MTPSDRQKWDLNAYSIAQRGFDKAVSAGMTEDRAGEILSDALMKGIEAMTPGVVNSLIAAGPRMIRDEEARRQAMRQTMRARWGEALDAYVGVWVGMGEAAADFFRDTRPGDEGSPDHVFDVLASVTAASHRIGMEVFHLLLNGFPTGALARSRTLHELAVTAFVIAEFGRRPEGADLAERYLLHAEVNNYKDAQEFQAAAKLSGVALIPDIEMERLRKRNAWIEQSCGRGFRSDWGWAVPLFSNPNDCNLASLERLTRFSGLRERFKDASLAVHAMPAGLALNVAVEDEKQFMVTDSISTGLAAPAISALQFQMSCVIAFLIDGSPNPESPYDLALIKALQEMFQLARSAFENSAIEGPPRPHNGW